MKILGFQFIENQKIKDLCGKIKKEEKKINFLNIPPALFEKIFKSNYLKQAYSSTKIEYSLISYNNAQKILNYKKALNEEEREILNVANSHLAIQQNLQKRLSDNFIINIHKQISYKLKGSLTEPNYRPGQYRNIQNYLGDPFSNNISYTFPNPKEVPILMKKLNCFININKKLNKLLLPGIFHFVFIAIHPFINGNGRTVRVIEDFLLKKAGYNLKNFYNLSQYYYDNLKQYHLTLNIGRDQKNLIYFIEFYLQGVLNSQKNVFVEKDLLERLYRLHEMLEWKLFDSFDKKILNYLARNNELTIKKAIKLNSRKLTAEAIRLRFQKYIEIGLMKKIGDFKNVKY